MLKIILTIGSIQLLAIVINFIKTKLVAVLAGAEGVGVIGTIDQFVQSASYFSALSLPFASVKFLSKAHSEGEDAFRQTYSSFLKALLMLSAAGTLIAAGIVFLRPQTLGQEAVKYQTLLGIALLGIPTMVLGGFFMQTLAAAQKPRQSSVLTLITGAALTAASVAGLAAAGIYGLYLGTVVVGFLTTIAAFIYLKKAFGLPLYERAASFIEELKRSPSIIPFALMLYLAALTFSLSFLAVRYATLKHYGEANAGLLHAAIALSLAISAALSPANGLYLTPIMNRSIEKEEKIKAALDFKKRLAFILCLISMPIVLFPELVLTILFSTEFIAVGQYVFLFIAAQFVSQMAGVNQALLIGFDDLKFYSLLTCIGHISLGLLAWFLIPSFGIFGAAIGFIVAYSVIFISTLLRLRSKHGFYMSRNLALLMLYGLGALLTAGTIFSRYEPWGVTVVIAKIGVCLFFIISLVFYLSKEERSFLYGTLDKIRFKKILNA